MSDQSGMSDRRNPSLSMLVAFSAAQSFSIASQNVLDVVVPLFQPIATLRHGRIFTAEELASDISSRYDLLVSEETCKYWGQQLAKSGMIVPADPADLSGAFVWRQSDKVSEPEDNFSAELSQIVESFREFLSSEGDLFSTAIADEKIYDILQKGAVGSLFPKLYETGSGFISDEQYIFSRFVETLSRNKSEVLDSIVRLRRAAIVCDLILHLRAPKLPPKNPQPILVYIDSPLIMDIIGLSGKTRQKFSQKLMEGFAALGFVPTINPDMIYEVGNNITGLLRTDPSRRYGPTADAIRQNDLSLAFVEAALTRVEPMVEEAGIKIDRNFPSHTNRSKVSDELEQSLFSKLQSHYNSVDAATRDARTVRGVLGRRGDLIPTDMYSCRAMFLTGNDMVATVSNKFFRDNIGYSEKNFPVVVGRATAAALVDTIIGVSAGGNLSLQDLLISSADVTQYDPIVVSSIEERLKLISPTDADDLVALLSSTDYSRLTMDMMLGNTRNVNVESVGRLVENVKGKIERAAEKRVATRHARERAKSAEAMDSLARQMEDNANALSVAISQLEEQHKAASHLVRTWVAEAQGRMKNYQIAVKSVAILAAVAVAWLVYISIDRSDWLAENWPLRLFVAASIGLVTGLPFIGLPPLRNAIVEYLARKEWERLSRQVEAVGYKLSTIGGAFSAAEIISSIDEQFGGKVAAIETASRYSKGLV